MSHQNLEQPPEPGVHDASLGRWGEADVGRVQIEEGYEVFRTLSRSSTASSNAAAPPVGDSPAERRRRQSDIHHAKFCPPKLKEFREEAEPSSSASSSDQQTRVEEDNDAEELFDLRQFLHGFRERLQSAGKTQKGRLGVEWKNLTVKGAGTGTTFVRTFPDAVVSTFGLDQLLSVLLKMFGISHTENTIVGNEYVRGVSGGERKRVSIAETLVTRASVIAFDNSTRGLDASTAVDYVRSMRILTDVTQSSTIATLYQAGEGIYKLLDRVLLIDEGRMIYNGPADEARAYFERLGFLAAPRQTTPDFLTSITDPGDRKIRPGGENRAPRTPEEREKAFRDSPEYAQLMHAVDHNMSIEKAQEIGMFKMAVRDEKKKRIPKASPYTVSYPEQIYYCTKGSSSIYTKFATVLVVSFVVSSLFYGEPQSSSGAFTRGGILFFSILFTGWLQLSEIMDALSGRTIIQRHREFAFYRPSAVSFARVVADLPLLFFIVVLESIIVYFLANLQRKAGQFFIYFLFVFITTINLTSFYRAVSALSRTFNEAIRFSVIGLNIAILFIGYVLPRQYMPSWFKWISYINA